MGSDAILVGLRCWPSARIILVVVRTTQSRRGACGMSRLMGAGPARTSGAAAQWLAVARSKAHGECGGRDDCGRKKNACKRRQRAAIAGRRNQGAMTKISRRESRSEASVGSQARSLAFATSLM